MVQSASAIKAWIALVRAHSTAQDIIERALKDADLPPLEWYDVLLELERAMTPLRPVQLEAKLLVAQYNLSRLLDRMTRSGLIASTKDPNDGRGRLVTITPKGANLRARAWPVYRAAMEQAVGSALNSAELRTLIRLLERLRTVPVAKSGHAHNIGTIDI